MNPITLIRTIAGHSRGVSRRKPAPPAKVRAFLATTFERGGPALVRATISERRTVLVISIIPTPAGAHLGLLELSAIAYRLGARLCELGAGAAPTTTPAVMIGDDITIEIDLDEAADIWRELARRAVPAEGIAL